MLKYLILSFIFLSCTTNTHIMRSPSSEINSDFCFDFLGKFGTRLELENFDKVQETLILLEDLDQTIKAAVRTYDFDDYVVNKNNNIIKKLQSLFSSQGVETKVKKVYKAIDDDNFITYDALTLINTKKSSPKAFRHLQKLKVKMDIDTINFDLISGSLTNASGEFQYNGKRKFIEFSKSFIANLFVYDDILNVGRHEVAHAMFKKMRDSNIDSPFHTTYRSTNSSALTKTGLYKSFVSAEELYTYSGNLYWASKNINIKNLDRTKKERILFLYNDLAFKLESVSEQIYDLTNEAKRHLEDMIHSNELLYAKTWAKQTSSHDKNTFFVTNEKEKKIYTFYEENLDKYIEEISKNIDSNTKISIESQKKLLNNQVSKLRELQNITYGIQERFDKLTRSIEKLNSRRLSEENWEKFKSIAKEIMEISRPQSLKYQGL